MDEMMIKQAYAYGVTIALQEAGMDKEAADEMAIQLAEEKIALTLQSR